MRIRSAVLWSSLLWLGFAPAAGAAILSFTGTLGFQVGGSVFPSRPVELSGSGVATVNGSGGGAHLSSLAIPAGAFVGNPSVVLYNQVPISGLVLAGGYTTQVVHLTSPSSLNLQYLTPTGSAYNGAGSFGNLSNSANNLAGTMPLSGVLVVCLFGPCSGFVVTNLIVPLSVVGQGGTATAMGAPKTFTAIGAPWLKNTATVTAYGTPITTIMGFAHGPASATQSTTAQPGGVVSLVTPVLLLSNLAGFEVVPVFGRVTVHFVPEPSELLLLGVGVAFLGVIGRRKARPPHGSKGEPGEQDRGMNA